MVRDLIEGEQWTRTSKKGNQVRVTDREMLNAHQNAVGWEKIVYEFGCQLIHLSNFHDYEKVDPVLSLTENTKLEIITYLTQYHGFDEGDLNFDSLVKYIPNVIDKICDNTDYFVKEFENIMLGKIS